MNDLYRDPVNGKISGVCAGLANRFGIEVWVIRILFVTAALLGGGFLMVIVYIAATLMLEKEPEQVRKTTQQQYQHQMKQNSWQTGQSAHDLLAVVEKDLQQMEASVRQMEAHVTSQTYKTNKAFSEL